MLGGPGTGRGGGQLYFLALQRGGDFLYGDTHQGALHCPAALQGKRTHTKTYKQTNKQTPQQNKKTHIQTNKTTSSVVPCTLHSTPGRREADRGLQDVLGPNLGQWTVRHHPSSNMQISPSFIKQTLTSLSPFLQNHCCWLQCILLYSKWVYFAVYIWV